MWVIKETSTLVYISHVTALQASCKSVTKGPPSPNTIPQLNSSIKSYDIYDITLKKIFKICWFIKKNYMIVILSQFYFQNVVYNYYLCAWNIRWKSIYWLFNIFFSSNQYIQQQWHPDYDHWTLCCCRCLCSSDCHCCFPAEKKVPKSRYTNMQHIYHS